MLKLKKRKILQITKYSNAITIPKIWLDQFDLKKGETVNLTIDDDRNLIISAGKQTQ